MKCCVVIGGGRWGRIIAGKLSLLGYQVRIATDFPRADTDISRQDISLLDPVPDLIYVASKSTEHERDFELVGSLGTQVWIEKNFSGMSAPLIERFANGDNFVFNQQLFNMSLDRYTGIIRSMRDFPIATDVDRPIITDIDLFDWICHDLSLIARILWIRGETAPLTITNAMQLAQGVCTAQYVINGVEYRIILRESPLRCRVVAVKENAALVAGRDGVLWHRTGRGIANVPGGGETGNDDLLGAALKVAMEARTEDVRTLTKILLDLHRVTFPLVQKLEFARN